MKYIVKSIVLLLLTYQTAIANETSFWKQKDKQMHFAVSAVIATTTTAYARNKGYDKVESFFIGFGTTVLIGLIKEGIDGRRKNGHQETDDMKANILGAMSGALISTQFEWKF